uniref:Uncharacterized protein n=1 Tax=Arundo donax TaxID=35708 RepID=A0A0A9FKC3_ARUDO
MLWRSLDEEPLGARSLCYSFVSFSESQAFLYESSNVLWFKIICFCLSITTQIPFMAAM